jgi:hypothetical protein
MNAFKKFAGVEDGGSSSSSSAGPSLPIPIPGLGGGNKTSGTDGGLFNEMDGCALTKKQRFMGFGACFCLGMLISFLSTMNITKPTSFALLYTLGNIVSFLSTGFLVGPKKQCQYVCEKKRLFASLIFLGSMITTLGVAIGWKDDGSTGGAKVFVCILLIIIQFCALVWYTASYIPFARQMIAGVCKSVCGRVTGAAGGAGGG